MIYENILPAVFVDRPNRFIAHVELNGRLEVCHVKNTGRCRELLIPGCRVYVQHQPSPARKTAYDLIAVEKDGRLLNIDYALSLSIDAHEESGYDTPVISLSVSGRALPQTVESLRFVPVSTLDRLDGETAESYYQRMAALTADDECFTVSLSNLE